MTKSLILVFMATLFSVSSAAAATVTFNVQEVGDDVVFEGSGSVDLTGLRTVDLGNNGAGTGIDPFQRILIAGPVGASDADFYSLGPLRGLGLRYGIGASARPSDGSGDILGFFGSPDIVILPDNYVSLSDLSSFSIYADQSFASLGITPGIYSATFGNNIWTVNVGQNAVVPLPGAFLLYLSSLVGVGLIRHRTVTVRRHALETF